MTRPALKETGALIPALDDAAPCYLMRYVSNADHDQLTIVIVGPFETKTAAYTWAAKHDGNGARIEEDPAEVADA